MATALSQAPSPRPRPLAPLAPVVPHVPVPVPGLNSAAHHSAKSKRESNLKAQAAVGAETDLAVFTREWLRQLDLSLDAPAPAPAPAPQTKPTTSTKSAMPTSTSTSKSTSASPSEPGQKSRARALASALSHAGSYSGLGQPQLSKEGEGKAVPGGGSRGREDLKDLNNLKDLKEGDHKHAKKRSIGGSGGSSSSSSLPAAVLALDTVPEEEHAIMPDSAITDGHATPSTSASASTPDVDASFDPDPHSHSHSQSQSQSQARQHALAQLPPRPGSAMSTFSPFAPVSTHDYPYRYLLSLPTYYAGDLEGLGQGPGQGWVVGLDEGRWEEERQKAFEWIRLKKLTRRMRLPGRRAKGKQRETEPPQDSPA